MKKNVASLLTAFLLSVLVAAAVVAGLPATAAAADACKNVKFRVTNSHKENVDVRIVKVRFKNPHNGGKEQTENVANEVCKPGVTCTTNGDNLNNADKVDLRSIQIIFRYKEADGDWSDEFATQPFTPAYPKCGDDKVYGPIVIQG